MTVFFPYGVSQSDAFTAALARKVKGLLILAKGATLTTTCPSLPTKGLVHCPFYDQPPRRLPYPAVQSFNSTKIKLKLWKTTESCGKALNETYKVAVFKSKFVPGNFGWKLLKLFYDNFLHIVILSRRRRGNGFFDWMIRCNIFQFIWWQIWTLNTVHWLMETEDNQNLKEIWQRIKTREIVRIFQYSICWKSFWTTSLDNS